MDIKDKYQIKEKFTSLHEVSSELDRLDAALGSLMESMDSLDPVNDREALISLVREGDALAEAMTPIYEFELFLKNNSTQLA